MPPKNRRHFTPDSIRHKPGQREIWSKPSDRVILSRYLLPAVAVATLTKLLLAIFTLGSNDVVTWTAFLNNIRQVGGANAYRLRDPYGVALNHPPSMVHVLKFLGFLADTTHIPFSVLLRLPAIIADIGSVLLVWLFCTSLRQFNCSRTKVLALALCPISILISGFHGNTDPVMVFFLLLAIYLVETEHLEKAGLAFGMAINIKVVPLILVPTFFVYLRNYRSSLKFFGCAALIILFCWMPYLAQEPVVIIKNTLGYKGLVSSWGVSLLLQVLNLSNSPILLKLLIIGWAIAVPFWMKKRTANLYTQVGVIIFSFFLLTPAFGVQYLAWGVPFVLSLELRWTLCYYVASGVFLFLLYNYWSHGNWYFAESHLEPSWNIASVVAGFVCWLLIGIIVQRFFTK